MKLLVKLALLLCVAQTSWMQARASGRNWLEPNCGEPAGSSGPAHQRHDISQQAAGDEELDLEMTLLEMAMDLEDCLDPVEPEASVQPLATVPRRMMLFDQA
jgi:hypothetical protein